MTKPLQQYSVVDIARFIVEFKKSTGDKFLLNNLMLQKILYFLEVRALVEHQQSLFTADIEKWKHGPVIPEVYHLYKKYGAEEITRPEKELKQNSSLEEILGSYDNQEIPETIIPDKKTREFIISTINALKDFHRFQLVEKTHEHPEWKKDQDKIYNGERHLTYDREKLKEDFLQNEEFQIWKTHH